LREREREMSSKDDDSTQYDGSDETKKSKSSSSGKEDVEDVSEEGDDVLKEETELSEDVDAKKRGEEVSTKDEDEVRYIYIYMYSDQCIHTYTTHT
jgi:hypothetical protein